MAKQAQKLFRVGAAAHELGLHPMTVRRWIKAGRIQVIRRAASRPLWARQWAWTKGRSGDAA